MLEAKSPLQEELSSQKEDMEISFSKEDQNKEPLNDDEVTSIHDEGEEEAGGNNLVTSGADLVPHGEVDGAISPMRGAFVSLQEVPKDLICGDQGTIHEQHVPLLIDCETL